MTSRRIHDHVRSQWAGLIALFLVLTGGTAYAIDGPLAGQNTVGSEDIINNDVKSADIADGRVFNVDLADNLITGQKIKADTLTGGDIAESTLGTVPLAAQGGTGRAFLGGNCDPDLSEVPAPWVNCVFGPVPIGRPGRVLISGQVEVLPNDSSRWGYGRCRLEIDGMPISSETSFRWDGGGGIPRERQHATLTAVSNVLPAGNPVIGIECQEENTSVGTLYVASARLSAVSLSGG